MPDAKKSKTVKRYLVVGPNAVNGVPTGGEVELDPDDRTPGAVNVAALIEGGAIEAADKPVARRPSKDADGGDE